MYGILISTGILIATLLAEELAKKQGKNPQILWESLIFLIVFGVLGARLYHVVDYWEFYNQNPLQIPIIWKGGLGIFGGIFAGFFALVLYLRRKKEPILEWLDIVGLVTPLGQAIGRWGNYFNQELLPYAIYESGFNLLLFLILWIFHKRLFKQKGNMFFTYLMGYGTIRFFLEFIRENSWEIKRVNVAQLISLILVLISIYAIKKPSVPHKSA